MKIIKYKAKEEIKNLFIRHICDVTSELITLDGKKIKIFSLNKHKKMNYFSNYFRQISSLYDIWVLINRDIIISLALVFPESKLLNLFYLMVNGR